MFRSCVEIVSRTRVAAKRLLTTACAVGCRMQTKFDRSVAPRLLGRACALECLVSTSSTAAARLLSGQKWTNSLEELLHVSKKRVLRRAAAMRPALGLQWACNEACNGACNGACMAYNGACNELVMSDRCPGEIVCIKRLGVTEW